LERPWRARLYHNGRDIHLGYYRSRQEAVEARVAAAKEFGLRLKSDAERKIGELTKKMPKTRGRSWKSNGPTSKTKQAALAEMGISKQDAC
jgi:hypothetical protein